MKWWLLAIVAVVVAVLAWMLGQRGINPMKAVRLELDVLDAKTNAKKLLVNSGASEARRQIESEHKATIERMDSEQKQQATALAADPVALAAFLVRAGQG